MWWRVLVYGLVGWCLEVVFTGLWGAVFLRDVSLTGRTYLWMLPIYALGGLLLEGLRGPLLRRGLGLLGRCAAYVALIFAVELGSGALLRATLGRCPWDYGGAALGVGGLIRLDYAPLWYGCGLLFEWLRCRLVHVQAALRSAGRARPFWAPPLERAPLEAR